MYVYSFALDKIIAYDHGKRSASWSHYFSGIF